MRQKDVDARHIWYSIWLFGEVLHNQAVGGENKMGAGWFGWNRQLEGAGLVFCGLLQIVPQGCTWKLHSNVLQLNIEYSF